MASLSLGSKTAPLLELRAVERSPFLQPTNLLLDHGECCAIMGASGSGKSLLLRQVADLDPGRGEVFLNGQPRSAQMPTQWRQQVAYCPPEPGWWGELVSAHFPANNKNVLQLVQQLGLNADILHSQVYTLSSGERQRLGLARALLQNPKVLLLDEPTASLDKFAVQRVEEVLTHRRTQGCAILLVTHNDAQARRLASSCWVMTSGELNKAWT